MIKKLTWKVFLLTGISLLIWAQPPYTTDDGVTVAKSTNLTPDVFYIQVPNLVINTDDTHRTFIRKNEENGLKDIRQLLHLSNLEEKWIYLPEKEVWIELGIHSKKVNQNRSVGYRVFSRMEEIKQIFLNEKSLIDYHFHPENSAVLDQETEIFLKEANLEYTDKNILWAKENYFAPVDKIFSAIPVRDDLFQLIVSSCLFYQIHPEGHFCHKILSPYGVTTFSINEHSKPYIRRISIDDAERRTHLLSSHIDWYISQKLALKHNDIKDPETGIKIIRQTIRRLNNLDLVHFEFTPYEEYRSL